MHVISIAVLRTGGLAWIYAVILFVDKFALGANQTSEVIKFIYTHVDDRLAVVDPIFTDHVPSLTTTFWLLVSISRKLAVCVLG